MSKTAIAIIVSLLLVVIGLTIFGVYSVGQQQKINSPTGEVPPIKVVEKPKVEPISTDSAAFDSDQKAIDESINNLDQGLNDKMLPID